MRHQKGCQVSERLTFYYRSTDRHADLSDEKRAAMVNAIEDEVPGHGNLCVTRELPAQGACFKRKRAARIMRERGGSRGNKTQVHDQNGGLCER